MIKSCIKNLMKLNLVSKKQLCNCGSLWLMRNGRQIEQIGRFSEVLRVSQQIHRFSITVSTGLVEAT